MAEREMYPPVAPVLHGGGAPSHSHTLVLTGMIALGIFLCYRLAVPFVSALVWALALAVAFAPFHRWLESKLKRRTLAAAACVLVVGLILVVPATFVGQQLVTQAAKGAELVTAQVESGAWRRAIAARPRFARLADTIEQRVDLPGAVQTLATWLTNTAKAVVKGSALQAVDLLLTFYLLFYFLRDRHAALQALRSVSPLSDAEMDRLLARANDTILATVYGTLTVAAVQGVLGGLMFWWLGLPAPVLWGVVMGLLAVVPILGAFVVWVPVALFLALAGSWEKALILAVWGMVIVGGIDNLLLPILAGDRMKLHTVLAFMSMVGGVILFGPAGLILGPVVLTVTAVLLEIWRQRTAAEDATTEDDAGQVVEKTSVAMERARLAVETVGTHI